jgi:hypothetical protein
MHFSLPGIWAGAAAAILYALCLACGLDRIAGYYLPLLPLMTVALVYGTAVFAGSAFIAGSVLWIALDKGLALFFMVVTVLPLWQFISYALLRRNAALGAKEAREWYPMLWALCEMTLMFTFVFLGIDWLVPQVGHATLESALVKSMQAVSQQLANETKEAAGMTDNAIRQMAPIVFGLAGWIMMGFYYLLLACCNFILARKGMALRPSLAPGEEKVPGAFLALLAGSGALALLGGAPMRFSAVVVFMLALLPYMLYAASRIWRFFMPRLSS